MSTLRFSDGVNVNTEGPLRPLRLPDGWYVVGEGMLIPVNDKMEARDTIRRMKENREQA